jgi:hypothetical protein
MVRTSDILLLLGGLKLLSSDTKKLSDTIKERNRVEESNYKTQKEAWSTQKETYDKYVKSFENMSVIISKAQDFRDTIGMHPDISPSDKGVITKQINKLKERQQDIANLVEENKVGDEPKPAIPDKIPSNTANIAIAAAVAVANELSKLFDKFMAPGQELSKELKTAGLPSMVKAFNTVADPLIDMAEIISDSISPAFIPMIEKLAEGMEALLDPIEGNEEGLSKMDLLVNDITPVMSQAGDALVQLVPQIPQMIAIWVKFAAINWEGFANFFITHGDTIISILNFIMIQLESIIRIFDADNWKLPTWSDWTKDSRPDSVKYNGRDT